MDKNDLWQRVMKDIKPSVTGPTFNSFISPVQLYEVTDNPKIAYLATPKDFVANVIKKRYIPLLEKSFQSVTGEKYRVVIQTNNDYKENREKNEDNKASEAFDLKIRFKKENIFNPKFTFDNFVVGESNKYASAVCKAVAQNPSDVYNPLFIYGKSGLGKTHLLNAIGIYMLEHFEDLRVLYVSSETFLNDFIKSLMDDKPREFKNKYRKTDVLLIDDIQFLEGKDRMQEEFFHTFEDLYADNKQIILSGDRPPSRLTALDERLRSRFGSNMVAEILTPDYETRVAILMKKAENMNVAVDENIYRILSYIAENLENVRDMEGALTSILSLSQLMNEKPELSLAKRIVRDRTAANNVTPEKIKSAVCRHYKLKVSDLNAQTRKKSISYPRQIAMYLCRSMTDLSLPQIASIFSMMNHSTVKYACDKIESELKNDANLKAEIDKIKEDICD
ncbi:MAG: chromosomal replication initiator protein DnaA [Firmicutes bacterium]|nr:chromosomal replication initiator protein DnaA [Bacillota bacterium]